MWDFATGETKAEFRGHENAVDVAIFAPVNAYAAVRELAGLQVSYYALFLQLKADLQNAPAESRAKAPGAYIATGSRDKTIRIWDTSTSQCLKILTGHDNWITALVFHPSGKYLLSASDDKTVKVWDLAQGRCTKTIEAHGHFVTTMAWGRAVIGGSAANGDAKDDKKEEGRRVNVLATASVDQTVKVGLSP